MLFNFESPWFSVEVTNGGLAQLGERLPCKQEVTGSIPVISTISSEKRSNKAFMEPNTRHGLIAQPVRAHA